MVDNKNKYRTHTAGIYAFVYGEDIVRKPKIIKRYLDNKKTVIQLLNIANDHIEKIPFVDFKYSIPESLKVIKIDIDHKKKIIEFMFAV